ncbi:MAG TPA: beta-propeller fold lactonase family protein [Candidatus Sulfotelmatobacter sp.]|jgi:6-phosphogluconolactonase (cycloisomerase 2 family)|nr:beta-propeller fold lactonase family protein [Candidatus Sulfotelmatobacter sp.]
MHQEQLSLRRIVFAVVAVASLATLGSVKLTAENPHADNFVYVMTNKNPHNSVIQFQRESNGSLTWLREVPSGGSGTGATVVDPLGSQDSLVLSGDGHLVLAVNAGSNEVSVLQIENDKLRLRDKVWSGGDFPNSVTLSGDLVYVLNAKGATPHINGFRLDPNGFLQRIPGARVALPAGSAGANDIRFADDGTKLLVTVSGTNQILVFEVADNGIAGAPVPQTSAGASPFGIRFGRNGIAVVSEAAGSASSYSFNATDMLEVISGAVPDTQQASCWISLNRSATYAYVSNTGSGTISSYQIGSSGDLTLANAIAANTGGAPIDSSLSRDSKFIYVVDSKMGRVIILRVDAGNLVPIGAVSSLPVSIQGIAAQ